MSIPIVYSIRYTTPVSLHLCTQANLSSELIRDTLWMKYHDLLIFIPIPCIHPCMYACVHVCMYACVHVCMYVCVCVVLPYNPLGAFLTDIINRKTKGANKYNTDQDFCDNLCIVVNHGKFCSRAWALMLLLTSGIFAEALRSVNRTCQNHWLRLEVRSH